MAVKNLNKYSIQESLNRTYEVFTVTPTLDTSAYSDADVLFNPTAVTGLFDDVNDACMIKSITAIDTDDQGIAFEIYFTTSNTDFGTINATAGIADNTAILGGVKMSPLDADGDFDLFRTYTTDNIDLVIQADGSTPNVYIAGIAGGTPTHSVSGLTIKIGVKYL